MSTLLATPVVGSTKADRFSSLHVGSILSETQYYKVVKIVGEDVHVVNDSGEDIILNKPYINDCIAAVADQYSTEESKSRTEVIQLLESHPYTALQLSFNKKVDKKVVEHEIDEAYMNSTPKEASSKMKAALAKALDGEERVITGRHHGSKDEHGRLHFVDMEIISDVNKDYDTRLRLVDPRTINWLILKGVKYKVKK